MGLHKSNRDGIWTVWNHTFQWTDKHFTPEELLPLRQQADDLCVDTVDRLQAIVAKEKEINAKRAVPCRVNMYTVLEEHHEEDSVLQEFWERVNTVPDWVDWAQIKRGQEFLYRYLAPNLTGLALQGFWGGTATIAGGTEVLVRTGGFSLRVLPRRFLETFLWLLQVTMSLGSIQPGGEGHVSTVRVRMLHATVRHRLLKLMKEDPTYFDEAELGAPVNLRDGIHALAIFCCMPLFRQLPKIGIKPQEDETRDFLALFRYIGYLIGTPNKYFNGVEQCKATMESIMLYEPEPTEASKAIGMNFVTAIQDFPGINLSRPMIQMGCRILSGDELADKMGFPDPGLFYRASFRGCCSLLVAISMLQHRIPAFDQMIIKKSKEFVLVNVFGASVLEGGEKFEFTYMPQLNKFTRREDRQIKHSLWRPVEAVGFIVFLLEMSLYILALGALGKVLLATSLGLY